MFAPAAPRMCLSDYELLGEEGIGWELDRKGGVLLCVNLS